MTSLRLLVRITWPINDKHESGHDDDNHDEADDPDGHGKQKNIWNAYVCGFVLSITAILGLHGNFGDTPKYHTLLLVYPIKYHKCISNLYCALYMSHSLYI